MVESMLCQMAQSGQIQGKVCRNSPQYTLVFCQICLVPVARVYRTTLTSGMATYTAVLPPCDDARNSMLTPLDYILCNSKTCDVIYDVL